MERLDEPLAQYSRFFTTFVPIFQRLLSELPRLADDSTAADAVLKLVGTPDDKTAFRYLTAPPVSEDDLKTLAESTLSSKALASNPGEAQRVRDIVLHIIDPHRFPWIPEDRSPSYEEQQRAVVASAALVAARKVETSRRSNSKKRQEGAVKDVLRTAGFQETKPRTITMIDTAPDPGCFCGESTLGETRADVIVRLHDRRVLAIECKVSNSAVNSFKRVNHEAVGKARKWLKGFGDRTLVPAAVLNGVFSPANLETAQAEGLYIYWAHRLDDLVDFVKP